MKHCSTGIRIKLDRSESGCQAPPGIKSNDIPTPNKSCAIINPKIKPSSNPMPQKAKQNTINCHFTILLTIVPMFSI